MNYLHNHPTNNTVDNYPCIEDIWIKTKNDIDVYLGKVECYNNIHGETQYHIVENVSQTSDEDLINIYKSYSDMDNAEIILKNEILAKMCEETDIPDTYRVRSRSHNDLLLKVRTGTHITVFDQRNDYFSIDIANINIDLIKKLILEISARKIWELV